MTNIHLLIEVSFEFIPELFTDVSIGAGNGLVSIRQLTVTRTIDNLRFITLYGNCVSSIFVKYSSDNLPVNIPIYTVTQIKLNSSQ